jgi:hypothetical protein
MRTTNERGQFQVAIIAARVNIWASCDMMDAYPILAATRVAPPRHARHNLLFELLLVYVEACGH